MNRKHFLSLGCFAMFATAALGACGSGVEGESPRADTVLQASRTSSSEPQPDIHLNVPPPDSQDSDLAEDFFEKKETQENFDEALQEQIEKNQQSLPKPEDLPEGAVLYQTLLGGTVPVMATANCDVTQEFLCIDAPLPPEGLNDVLTVQPGVDVVVRIDLNQLAVFGDSPVAVVSVFNNDQGGAATETLIMPGDVENVSGGCTPENCVGQFETAVALGGPGRFTVVVSAYKSIDDGQINDLVSKMVTVYRTETPEIELLEVRPVTLGEEAVVGEPIASGATIHAERLRLKVKLLSTFSPGVQVRFNNYNSEGSLTGFDAVGYVASKESSVEDGVRVYTGEVLLHNGLNQLRIIGANPEAEKVLKEAAPAPMVLDFEVTNYFGKPRIKFLSPKSNQAIVPQDPDRVGQKVEVKFCYTLVPGIDGGVNDSEECVSGDLGFGACLKVNGRSIGGEDAASGESISYNKPEGVFTASINPDFGLNVLQVQVVDDKCGSPIRYTDSSSFLYGVPVKFIQNGEIQNFDTFSKRGINLDVGRSLLKGDVRQMIESYLAKADLKAFLLDTFKSNANKPGYSCQEYIDPNTGNPVTSNGDTTIEFLEETFELGEIELTDFMPSSDGMLHVGLIIHGLHGDADLKAAESNGTTVDGEIPYIPLRISLGKLEANLGIALPRKDDLDLNNDGVSEERTVLDIRPIEGKQFLSVIGDGPLGRPVYVDSSRYPAAAGIELLDWQQGYVVKQFSTILGGTFLCGLEAGFNNESSGTFGKATADLEKLVGYDENPLRFSLGFDFLGKALNMDVALSAFKGVFEIDARGVYVRDLPLRINPGPKQLQDLAEKFSEGIVGYVSRFRDAGEAAPQALNQEYHNLGLMISEDTLNSALAGAALSGLLQIDLDTKAYTKMGGPLSSVLLPNGSMFLMQQIDANLDGNSGNDNDVPVLLRLQADPLRPPVFSFLTEAEVARLADEEKKVQASAESEGGGEPKTYFDPAKKYFRLSVSGLEIMAFEQEKKPGSRTDAFCNVPVPTDDNDKLLAKGFCPVPGDAKTLMKEDEVPAGYVCPEADRFVVPRSVGDIVSRPSLNPEEDAAPLPIYRVRGNLVFHGEIQPLNNEVPATDRLKSANPKAKNILRLKLIPATTGVKEAFLTDITVLENRTGKPDVAISQLFTDFLNAAVGDDCKQFNEIKIAIPQQVPGEPEAGETVEPLLPDFGLEKVGLGLDAENYPEAFIDDNRLFLDLWFFADLIFTGE